MTDEHNLEFTFVDDSQLARLLKLYNSHAYKALEAKAYLGAIVGFGSVVEGMLTWALQQRVEEAQKSSRAYKDKAGGVRPLRKWNLTNLIDVSVELGLIGPVAKDAAWALKDFRNFIHPFNVLNQSVRPDAALAESAKSALIEITRSLKGRLAK